MALRWAHLVRLPHGLANSLFTLWFIMGSRTQGGHTLQYGHPPYFSSNYNYTNLNPDHNLKL